MSEIHIILLASNLIMTLRDNVSAGHWLHHEAPDDVAAQIIDGWMTSDSCGKNM